MSVDTVVTLGHNRKYYLVDETVQDNVKYFLGTKLSDEDLPTPESEIEVVSYETVTNEDGSQMDVAVVNAQGQAVMIADVDQNGLADIMASDLNYNGQLDNGEIVDVSDQNIAMQPLQDAANMNGNNMVAQTGEPDYINDANVDDYIA